MAFFDKLSAAAKNMGAKANDAIEKSQLNSRISAEKAAIAQDCQKIGEFYCSKHLSGGVCDGEISELLASVDQHNAAIKDLEAQIQKIVDAAAAASAASSPTVISSVPAAPAAPAVPDILCPTCGKPNKAGTKFCSECGAKLEAEQPAPAPEQKVCPACGAPVEADVKFCPACGAKVE
jgi:predicted nucleic acid-binding Zn ribbon protein